MKFFPVSQIAQINPSQSSHLTDDKIVSFLSMSSVLENGTIENAEERIYRSVKKGYTAFQRGDVIVAKITPCMENGKAAFTGSLPNDFAFGSTEFHVLRPRENIDGKYLFYMIWNPQFRFYAEKAMTGSAGQKRVPAGYFARHQVPVPVKNDKPDITEQRRIAAILDKADAIRRKRRDALAHTDELLRSIFLDMFGDPITNPKGLRKYTLGDISNFVSGNSLPLGQEFNDQEGGFLLLKVGDMNASENIKEMVSAREWIREKPKGLQSASRGAILIPKRGGAILTNKKRILTRLSILDPNLMAIQPNQDIVSTEFLYTWFQFLDLATITSGSAVPQLNKQDLNPLRIFLPSREDLENFSKIYSKLTAITKHHNKGVTNSDQLFNSCLQRAFKGEL